MQACISAGGRPRRVTGWAGAYHRGGVALPGRSGCGGTPWIKHRTAVQAGAFTESAADMCLTAERSEGVLACAGPDEIHSFAATLSGGLDNPIGQAWIGYNSLLVTHPLATDAATAVLVYALSDAAAQQIPKYLRKDGDAAVPRKPIDLWRVLRYSVFGFLDGVGSHWWFEAADRWVPGETWVATAEKVVLDSAVFNPMWCVVFIISMAAMEGKGLPTMRQRLRDDLAELTFDSSGVWIPVNCLIYGFLPLELRVLGLTMASLFFAIWLSLWQSQPGKGDAGEDPALVLLAAQEAAEGLLAKGEETLGTIVIRAEEAVAEPLVVVAGKVNFRDAGGNRII